ncbi:MAG: hypothetical protein ABIR78_07695 [Ferruginibacter sp.]
MFKRLILLPLALFIFISAYAQKVTPCGYIIPPKSLSSKFASVYEAKEVVNNMLSSIQWQENFSLREVNGMQNAYATIINGTRWIVYDNNFLEDIDEYAKTKWASMSIVAHEMGHHYYNHVVSNRGSSIPLELEADAFSGYVMQKMGATLDQALAAMSAIGTPTATSTHPAKANRLSAITRGWNAAKENKDAGTANTGTQTNPGNTGNPTNPPNPPGPGSTQTNADNDPSWIALYMQSTKDETVQLSDDGKTYQPAVIKAGGAFVFKFEIYQYGWLKLPYYNGYRTYKLLHGKDYTILYNRRNKNWTVVEIPE